MSYLWASSCVSVGILTNVVCRTTTGEAGRDKIPLTARSGVLKFDTVIYGVLDVGVRRAIGCIAYLHTGWGQMAWYFA